MNERFSRSIIDGIAYDRVSAIEHIREAYRDEDRRWTGPVIECLEQLMAEDPQLTARTSGTTGAPKQLSFKSEELIASAELTARTFGLQQGDRVFHALPCEFIAGRMMIARALILGLDLHLVDPASDFIPHLTTGPQYAFTALVPFQVHKLLNSDPKVIDRSFAKIILGGGPLDPTMETKLRSLTAQVWHTYGMTETCTHVAIRQVAPLVEEKFNALDGISFELTETGQLVIHTPHLRVGEHVTQDLVELIDDRHFIWLGRKDNVVLSGGLKLYPEQLEAHVADLIGSPFIFYGCNDSSLGQRLELLIEGKRPSSNKLHELEKALSERLNKHERPKQVRFTDRFAYTSSGKIQRGATVANMNC